MRKLKNKNLFILGFVLCASFLQLRSFAQNEELELNLDFSGSTTALPKIFKPNMDLSGRGFHSDKNWPQGLAAPEVVDSWQHDIGFSGIYRLQYNLWEIQELAKDKAAQDALLRNYENTIKRINDSGGKVILDIFGTPAGLGKVLDKKSPPVDLRAFKELVKASVRNLSCDKKYNIWYEVWSAPDLDDFFLGRKQEYLNMYRAVAEGIKELETETKMHIPLGGPGVSWWFQNLDINNTVITPERSLIYELIRFCYHYRLPLDFITWHAYSTDPAAELYATAYKKNTVNLIRDWLFYFHFPRNIALIVDEWNYDSGDNILQARQEKSNIGASYIPARLNNMQIAGIDYGIYFCLEDFQGNTEGVVRNVGAFSFDSESPQYKGQPKAIYNAFRMLSSLGADELAPSPKINDEFSNVIATKSADGIAVLIYNYIDPEIARNYAARSIAALGDTERKILLNLIKAGKFEKIMRHELDIPARHITLRLKTLLSKARELNDRALKLSSSTRNIKINIKNLKGNYLYQRFTVDSSCGLNCEFLPAEKREVAVTDLYQETLALNPYSINLIILKPRPKGQEVVVPTEATAQVLNAALEGANATTAPAADSPGAAVPTQAPAASAPLETEPKN